MPYRGSGRLAQALGGMIYLLRYRAMRSEIWHWYWRHWCRGFWLIHVLFAAMLAIPVATNLYEHMSPTLYVATFAWLLPLVTMCAAAIPQLMFKSSERFLEISPKGWSTTIGRVSGSKPWSQVYGVKEEDGALIIISATSRRGPGNALIVPQRALPRTTDWGRFVQDVMSWHAGHAP